MIFYYNKVPCNTVVSTALRELFNGERRVTDEAGPAEGKGSVLTSALPCNYTACKSFILTVIQKTLKKI